MKNLIGAMYDAAGSCADKRAEAETTIAKEQTLSENRSIGGNKLRHLKAVTNELNFDLIVVSRGKKMVGIKRTLSIIA